MSFENHIRYETDHVCCGCHQANGVTQVVESFRERAVRAIQTFIDERQLTSVPLPSFKTELASLVESLPLEPEQEEKL